ncbi:MAG: hypothetical protein ACKVP4_00925 [Hyphomicrobium sp.]
MQDTASHSSPELDNGELRHTLSVHDVGAALVAAGVPRSHRQVVRYCETAMLDAVKVPGPTGAQWYVSPASLPKVIGDLKQWEAQRARHSSPQHDTSDFVRVEKMPNSNSDTASHGARQPATSEKVESPKGSETELVATRYVGQLEKRIEEKDDVIGLLKGQLIAKDEQIGELSTRYRETHSLLGAMQRMFAPLLGQSDPYTAPDKREATQPVDN